MLTLNAPPKKLCTDIFLHNIKKITFNLINLIQNNTIHCDVLVP